VGGGWPTISQDLYVYLRSFTIFICVLLLVVWGAMWLSNRRSERRHRARQAEWEELTRRHSDLDRELDRVWYGR